MAHPLQALAGFLSNRQRKMDVDYLQRGREDRARKERDAQRALEAERHKERLDRQEELDRRSAFGLQQDFYTKIQDPAQIEPHMKEFQRRGVPGADAPGTLGPTMPTVEQIQLMRTLGVPVGEVGDLAPAAAGALPVGTPETVEYGGGMAPTQPMARGYYDALVARRGAEDEALRRKSGVVVAGHMREQLMADPTGEGAGLIFQMDTEGAPPPSRDAVVAAARRGAAELKSVREADRAARRPRGPRPLQAPEGKLKRLISRGNFAGYRRMAKAGNILELRGASEEQIQAAWDKDRMGYESDVMDKARRHSENKRMKVMLKKVAELQQQRRVGSAKWSAREQKSLKRQIDAELRGMDSLGSILDERTARGVDSPAASGDVVPPGTKTPTDAGAAKPKARQKVRPIRPKMGDVIDQETGQTLESVLFTARRSASPAAARKYLKDAFADVLRQNVQEVIVSTPSGDVNIIELLKAQSPARQSLLLKMLTSTTKVDLSPGAVEAKAREEARRKRERQAQIKALGGR